MDENRKLEDELIDAWVLLTSTLKNTRLTNGMIYNEAIIMLFAYRKYRTDGEEAISFREIADKTKMAKSLVNRTIDALVGKNLLERVAGQDRRTTYVRPVAKNLSVFLNVHRQSLALAHTIVDIIGEEDAEAFVRLSQKIVDAKPLSD